MGMFINQFPFKALLMTELTSMECKRIHNLAHRDARKSRLLLFLFSGEKVPANIAAILIQDIPLLKSPEDSRLVIIKTIKEMQGFIESLSFKNQVAVGGFAKVWRAQASKEDGVNYAIKSIPKSREQLQDVAREVKAGELLKAKNIVNFICSFEKDDQYHLVFDFVKGKALKFKKPFLTDIIRCRVIWVPRTKRFSACR